MRGGYREGAGRKKGFAAKNAEEARKYFAERVAAEIESLFDSLLSRAKSGDIRSIKELFDRAWGRPRQEEESVFQEPIIVKTINYSDLA